MILRLREIPLCLGEKETLLPQKIAGTLKFPVTDIISWKIVRKGIDARKKPEVLRVYSVDFEVPDPQAVLAMNAGNPRLIVAMDEPVKAVAKIVLPCKVVVAGMGPAGLFAALSLAESGARVTLVERGRPVAERLGDVQRFWQHRQLNPESNMQFGEGGAGTFSDGKLTSRLNNPYMQQVLMTLVRFGAPEEILWQAKPHVGSDRLRALLVRFREHLIGLGVEILFSTRLTGIETAGKNIVAVELNDADRLETNQLVLALGHSARDSYQMLYDSGVAMAAKAFAIGLRVEHPLELINSIQYGMEKHPDLPPAEYSLAWNNKHSGRGCYSFCMCPGGMVVNASSEPGKIVVNGMSNFRRDTDSSNSALVVAVRPGDFDAEDPLSGMRFQRHWEQQAFIAGGANWSAPAQPLLEFLNGKGGRLSSSCRPQVKHTDLSTCLPGFVTQELRSALPQFERRMRGFISEEASLVGIETRTSAPLRILRSENCESISHSGFYPAGEGAGYAGGIMSAAVDGLKVAESIIKKHTA